MFGWLFGNDEQVADDRIVEADALPQFGYYDKDLDFAANADEPLDFNELDVEPEPEPEEQPKGFWGAVL